MRLIDADELKEYINGEVFMKKSSKAYLKNIVNKQPVAFDIEAVVKELEKEKSNSWSYERRAFDKAIDVIRKGGVKNG